MKLIISLFLTGILMVSVLPVPVYAHIPSGYSQKISTQVDDYFVRIIILPARPEVNRSCEIIAGIINSETNAPFDGTVKINGIPAVQFSQGFYEITYIFDSAGNHTVLFEFDESGSQGGLGGQDGQKGEILKTEITIEVVDAPGPGRLFLGGMAVTLFILFVVVWYIRSKKVKKDK